MLATPPPPQPTPTPAPACGRTVFPAERFTRTTGSATVYNRTFNVPSWVVSPYRVTIQNGEANGSNRISSAEVFLNNVRIVQQNELNQNVPSLTKTVTLMAGQNTLRVSLTSKPGSYLTLGACGTNGDNAPPTISLPEPPNGSFTNDATPRITSRYLDGVSGIDTASFGLRVDGVDRTSLFIPRSDEASADMAPALLQGAHTVTAEIKDVAGNLASAATTFTVDLTPPVLRFAAPTEGAAFPVASVATTLDLVDLLSGINTSSLRIQVNGTDRTSLFALASGHATATLGSSVLVNGANHITATVRDVAGTESSASVSFSIDTTAPILAIGQPIQGSRLGASSTPLIVQFSDDQQLRLASFTATLDGSPVTMTVAPESATGVASTLAEGAHVFVTSIADMAGNTTTRQANFTVDTQVPSIVVDQPAPSFLLPTATPFVSIVYSDAQGVDTATFRVVVDGVDRTAVFTVDGTGATATLPALPEGAHVIEAEIRDLTGNRATTSASFTTDTIAPAVTITSPSAGARLNTSAPQLGFTYQDQGGSGVEPQTIRVRLDGVDITASFVLGDNEAVGVAPSALADGNHLLRVEVGDRANNVRTVETAFLIDTLAPTASFETPLDNSFTNDDTPDLRVSFGDTGRDNAGTLAPPSGVDLSSLHVFLRSGGPEAPEVDLTPSLTVAAGLVTGTLTSPLAAGTHRLRFTLRDVAGNSFETTTSFEVDRTAPTFQIVSIAPNAGVPTSTPGFTIQYQDDRSGVATGRFVFRVDGVDRTARLTISDGEATGSLLASDALADGPHTYDFTVFDVASNRTDSGTIQFFVDTVVPVAALVEPQPQSFIGVNTPQIRFTFQDASPSAGIDPGSTRVYVDGVDRTAEFTITADGALITSITPPFADGAHSVRADIVDFAGNSASATGQFTVDTQSPQLTLGGPADGSVIGGAATNGNGTISLQGTIADIDLAVTVSCATGAQSVAASIEAGVYRCVLPIVEGANTFVVTATDTTGHASTITRTLILDTTLPVVVITAPVSTHFTPAQTMTVRGTVADATAVSLTVNGVVAIVTPGPVGSPSTFEATNVPVGPGPTAVFTAVATDAGGNVGTAAVTIGVDRIAPVVTITVPETAAYLPGVETTVVIQVKDSTLTSATVNSVVATRGACVASPTPDEPARQQCTFEARIPITPGALTIAASSTDAAGNQGLAQISVTVDATAPVLTVITPAAGLITKATSLSVTGTVTDSSPLTLTIDGVSVTPDAAGSYSLDVAAGPEGLRSIQLLARDAAGNETPRTVVVTIDRTAPVLTIGQPSNGARLGSSTASVTAQFSDDHLDVSTFTATLDGAAFTMTVGAGSATGVASGLAEGAHTVVVSIADRAGNLTTREVTFTVDTTVPSIVLDQPVAASLLSTATPAVAIRYSDAQGVDTATLRILVDGADRTSRFTILPDGATATLEAVAEGAHTLVAQIKDLTGNLASTTIEFSTDTIVPQVAIVAPLAAARLNTARPALRFTYLDPSGSGIAVQSAKAFLDGVDITTSFALSATEAIGAPPSPLADGNHTLRVEVADLAQNVSSAEITFHVDTIAPTVTIESPAEGLFTNDVTPAVRISFADPGGNPSGVSAAALHVYLSSPGPATPDVEVTSSLTVAGSILSGDLPGALVAGKYRLRVTLADQAGNAVEASTLFEVDVTAPTFEVVQLPANAVIATRTPAFLIRYSDDSSGVAVERFAFRVDGVDRTARLNTEATQASGTLLEADALAEGPHTYDFTIFDKAGNRTDSGPIAFVVDVAPPTATLVEPAPLSFIGLNTPRVRFEFVDGNPSSGINPAATRIQVDGTDRTADFSVTAGGAMAAALAPALADGEHTVRADIADMAGNPAFVIGRFTVDTQPPVLTPEIPETGRLVGGSALSADGRATVTGTVFDIDPTLTATCAAGAAAGVATVSNGAYSCLVPVVEGANQISVTITDSTGHAATATRTLTVDRIAPAITISEPTEGLFTAALTLTVGGQVTDASAVTVSVNGQAAVVTPAPGAGPATYEATSVSVGSGPSAPFNVVATDAAGNTATVTVTVRVDRKAPVVVITVPAQGAYLRGGVTTVNADVTDETATILDLNGVQGVSTGCVDVSGGEKKCSFTADIPILAGGATIVATAFDEAGNRGVAQISATVDNTPPSITVASPVSGFVSNATSLSVAGTVSDTSPITLTVNGESVATAANGSFSATITQDILGVPLSSFEGARGIVFEATDAAGNQSAVSIDVVFDRTPPALTLESPLQGAVVPNSSVSVSGTVVDATQVVVTVQGSPATVMGYAYSASIGNLSEGPLTITVHAVDAAGNESTVTRGVEIDLAAPTVGITSPGAGSITRDATAVLAYTVLDRSRTTITVNNVAETPDCPGVLACDRTKTVDLVPGDNTFTVEATDAGGRSTSAQVTITRDSVAPQVELTTPETVSRGRVGTASASASDNLTLDRLEVRVGTTVICSGTTSCSAAIVVPETAQPGDSLTVTAIATDRALNTTTTSRSVRVTADGVVTGSVLNDLTSLPLSGASVSLRSGQGAVTRDTTTDSQGRYSIPVADVSAILRIEKAGFTSVDRQVPVSSGIGTVPLDARLTPLAAVTTHSPVIPATNPPETVPPTSVTPAEAGAQGTAGPVSLAVPDGSHRVTLLSAQGLPTLLPPGFSPLTAFNWATDGGSASAQASIALSNGAAPTALVRYDTAMRDWRVVTADLLASNSVLVVDIPSPGSYALAVADATTPPMAIAAPGEALTGSSVLPIPATATSESRVDPAVLPPTGGTATGTLRLDSPTAMPSGTIVQAEVEESYTLSSGEEAGAPKRSVDIVAYKHQTLATAWGTGPNTGTITGATTSTVCDASVAAAPSAVTPAEAGVHFLCAAFPITPSRTYGNSGLREGRVHLDLLAGRENARGQVGGNEATTVTSGAVRLNVAAGSLPEDTAISLVTHDTFSSFVPNGNGVTPLAEVTVDFAAATLNAPASLTFTGLTVVANESFVVARVDRAAYDGIPRLQVVALAEVQGADVVSVADTGLAGVTLDGITRTGRYVLFRLAGPVAFVVGRTFVVTPAEAGAQSQQSPVRALVTSTTLPFVTTSAGDGTYALAVNPGANTVTARVLGQSLVGTAQVTAISGTPVVADIALQGTVSQATVTPASGAVGVEVNEPLTLTSPVAINEDTITAANIRLRTVPVPPATGSVDVPLRFVLSGSGKQLSIIPTGPITTPPTPALAFSTNYALEVTGLLDTVGGLITAPTTAFRTRDDIKPVYNLKALTFSFPDADGLVTVSAPNGTLPPGTEILIINSGNGVVVGLTAGNDGQVNGTIPASTSDTLLITVTDPFGNTTTYESSKFFNAATGETSIGPGGGTIEGPNGTSLIIPAGALAKGLALKLDTLTPEEYDLQFPNQRPAFGNRPFGSVLKIHAAEPGTLLKPAKLTFNVPTNFATTHPTADPRDATFYVLKRSVLENGTVAFEVVDHAFAVCPGDTPGGDLPVRNDPTKPTCDVPDLQVKTASPPHPEFHGNIYEDTVIYLTYDWDAADAQFARLALVGVIVGRVRRQAWGTEKDDEQDKTVLRYENVEGARVFGSDAAGNPLKGDNVLFTTTRADGTYTMWDDAYTGGTVKVHAEKTNPSGPLETGTGLGYEGNPQDLSASWGPFPALRFYRNKAHVDVLFEAQEPPPPAPSVEVVVMREADKVDTRGISTVGTPLRIGFKNNRVGEVPSVTNLDINGANFTVTLDPNGKFAGITQGTWTPSQAGTYLLRTTAVAPLGGSIPVSATVRIVAAGGGIDTDHTQPPLVLEQRTYPKRGARNVQTSAFPTIAFSEPVVGVTLQTVHLNRADASPGPVAPPTTDEAFRITGVTASGQVIDDVSLAPTLPITSITIRPLYGLKYKQRYTLSLTSGIQDLDEANGLAAPKSLVPYTTTFDTFGPESIPPEGQPESYTTTGFYVAKDADGDPVSMWSLKHTYSGSLWIALLTGYDVSDPINVTETTSTRIIGRPVDLVGEGTTVAVATSPGARSMPSNVRLYDITEPTTPKEIGAASVANSAADGALNRITMRGSRIYAGSFRKGIQILDVDQMRSVYKACPSAFACDPDYFKMQNGLSGDGQGFNAEAIVQTIPVTTGTAQAAFFTGIKSILQGAEPLIVATGNFGLALAKEGSGRRYLGKPTKDGETLEYGLAMDVASVGGYDIAVVAAMSGTKQVLMTVDVTNPDDVFVKGVREIVTQNMAVVDVLVNGSVVYVSTQRAVPAGAGVEVFEISDPSNIAHLGRVDGVGGRLSIVGKLLYGATSGTFGAPIDGFGGVRTAALGKITVINKITENPVILALDRTSIEPQQVSARTIPVLDSREIRSAELEVLRDDTVIQTIPITLDATTSAGTATIPAGITHNQNARMLTRLVVNRDDDEAPTPSAGRLRSDQFTILPETSEVVEIAAEEFGVSAYSRAAQERLGRDVPGSAPPLRFEAPFIDLNLSNNDAGASGIYTRTYLLSGSAGQRGRVKLFTGSKLLAQTGEIMAIPGRATFATGHLRANPPPQKLNATPGWIPADGNTVITLTIEDVKDSSGNTVVDGTPVDWILDADDGELVGTEASVTVNGSATAQYRAGILPGTVMVTAEVGEHELRMIRSIEISQRPLSASLDVSDWPLVRLMVDSDAGPPRDQTEVGWGTVYPARLTAQAVLTDGKAHAIWSAAPRRPGDKDRRFAYVFGTVGRERGEKVYDLDAAPVLPAGGLRVRLSKEMVSLRAENFQGLAESTAAEIDGGTPGQIVTLALGSQMSPNVEPVALFPLDQISLNALENRRETPDYSGLQQGTTHSSVVLDSGDPLFQPGSFRFVGIGGVNYPSHPQLSHASRFGLNGWVRFNALTGPQTIIQKAGAYELKLIEEAGIAKVEFGVYSGGVRRRALSDTPLEVGEWYQFSAHVREGKVLLGFGANGAVVIGESTGGVDVSTADLALGSSLIGNLDEVAYYDLSLSPRLTFAGGGTTANVTLDGDGKGLIEIETGLAGSSEFYTPRAGAGGTLQITQSELRLNRSELLIVEPEDPDVIWERKRAALVVTIRPEHFIQCADALASGEPSTVAGFGCEIGAGFIPGVQTTQSLRDVYYVAKNFTQGKRTLGDYVKGTFAVVGLTATAAAAAVPILGGIIGTFKKAGQAVSLSRTEIGVAREAAEIVGKNLDSIPTIEGAAARVLGSADEETKAALQFLFGICTVRVAGVLPSGIAGCSTLPREAVEEFNRLATVVDEGRLARLLGRAVFGMRGLSLEARFHAVGKAMKNLDTVARVYPGSVAGISDEAFEGIVWLASHTKSPRRLELMFKEVLLGGGSIPDAANLVNQILLRLKQGQDKLQDALPFIPPQFRDGVVSGWHSLVALGPGTSSLRRSTQGFNHQLEDMLKKDWTRFRGVDREFARYPAGRRPDLLEEIGNGPLLHTEYKAVADFSQRDSEQLEAYVKAALDRTGGPEQVEVADLLRELPAYVFRGASNPVIENRLRSQLEAQLVALLPARLKDVASQMARNRARFAGDYPF
jgi:hypothetical protein